MSDSAGICFKAEISDLVRVDHLNRDPQYLPNPSLSAIFAIQPSVLEEIMSNQVMNGCGLIARFLFASSPSFVGNRTFRAPNVPATCVDEHNAFIIRLMDMPLYTEPVTLTLSAKA